MTPEGQHPVGRTLQFIFPAGEGTGTIREFALTNGAGGSPSIWVARQVIAPEIVKTDTHELRITIIATVSRQADSLSGVIPAGQRDGVTDIAWVATVNNRQLYRMCTGGASWHASTSAITGTSNAPSDLEHDYTSTIKGSQLHNGSTALASVIPYTTDTFYRDFRYGFEITQSNGAIGELLCMDGANGGYVTRITFDPPLDKINTFRLYLTWRRQVAAA